MAAFQNSEIAVFQTIHVTSDGHNAIAFPVDDQGRKGKFITRVILILPWIYSTVLLSRP